METNALTNPSTSPPSKEESLTSFQVTVKASGGWASTVRLITEILDTTAHTVVVQGPQDSSWKRRLTEEVRRMCGSKKAARVEVRSSQEEEQARIGKLRR
jgi:hypothetical protein